MTRDKKVLRAVAVVATSTISHGEELYIDYLQDQRIVKEKIHNAPDWLIEPPPENEFLLKKEFVAKVPFLVKMLHSAQITQLGRSHEQFDLQTARELPPEMEEKK